MGSWWRMGVIRIVRKWDKGARQCFRDDPAPRSGCLFLSKPLLGTRVVGTGVVHLTRCGNSGVAINRKPLIARVVVFWETAIRPSSNSQREKAN